jgi:hypothetical protein
MALGALAAALGLAACGPQTKYDPGGAAPGAHGEADHGEGAHATVDPNAKPSRAPFEGCAWEATTGAKLKVWTQACAYADKRQSRYAFDASGASLAFEEFTGGQWVRADWPSVQVFTLAPGAALTSLFPQIGVPAGAECGFTTPTLDGDAQRVVLEPIGATKAAYEAAVLGPDMPAPPCGPYGVGPIGDRYFEVRKGHEQQVLFVELGSELQAYDPSTIQFVTKADGAKDTHGSGH